MHAVMSQLPSGVGARAGYGPVKLKLQHPLPPSPPGHTLGIRLCIVPWKGGEFEPDLCLVLA